MQLQADGFLERRIGDGTYVARRLPRFADKAPGKTRPPSRASRLAVETFSQWARTAAGTHLPHASPRPRAFHAGFPALDAFPMQLWQRLTARCLRTESRGLLHYFPSMGYGPLREATARHLAITRGVVCAPEQVMILNSSMQALDLIGRVLLERGDDVWIEEAAYPNVKVALSLSGARITAVPVDGEGLDVAAASARGKSAALVQVTPACHFATGAPMSLRRRLALLQWAEKARAWIVEDDYQGEFTHDGRPLETLYSLDRGARVLHLGTFTNVLFPSLRLSYLVIPAAMCEVFEAVRAQLDDHTHGIAQAVLADFIDEGHLAAHIRRMRPIYKERRDVLVDAVGRHIPDGRLGPSGAGMHVSLQLPRAINDRTLRERGAKAGLALMPLSRYSPALNGLMLGYTALTPAQIRDGVRRLAALRTASS